MPVKDTHVYRKCADGRMRHFWVEQRSSVRNQFEFNDEKDSVSLTTTSETTDWRDPTVKVETCVRISYSDLATLIGQFQDILNNQE